MDESNKLSNSAAIVDLTIDNGKNGNNKTLCKEEKVTNKEVPIYLISDEEFLRQLPEKEKKWYEKNLKSCDEIDKMTVLCTACFKQTNHKKLGDVSRHPTLGVPMCKNCKNFYFDGAWTKDDDGSFEFCGWCAQGGELFLCADFKYV